MKNKIDPAAAAEFTLEMKTIRRLFPEFAKEIDRCIFDVGQNYFGSCGHGGCDCQMTFEDFHARQNAIFSSAVENIGQTEKF